VTAPLDRQEADVTVISNSVDIRCGPEDVFDYLSDHRSELEWNPGIESIDKITDGPVGLGTKYRAEWKSARRPSRRPGIDSARRPVANH
jgi:hypothetical protein